MRIAMRVDTPDTRDETQPSACCAGGPRCDSGRLLPCVPMQLSLAQFNAFVTIARQVAGSDAAVEFHGSTFWVFASAKAAVALDALHRGTGLSTAGYCERRGSCFFALRAPGIVGSFSDSPLARVA